MWYNINGIKMITLDTKVGISHSSSRATFYRLGRFKYRSFFVFEKSRWNDIIKEYQRHVNANALALIYLIFRHLNNI